jgi:hypothetical protein
MFVRWISRARRTGWEGPDVHHRAILIEAVRIDGKPRQRHIAYLIGFTESRARTHRVNIWDEIAERLDKLGERITTDRKKIEAAVAMRLPRPTAAERRNARRRSARNRKWFADRAASR